MTVHMSSAMYKVERNINHTPPPPPPPLPNASKATASYPRLLRATCLIAAAKTHRNHRDGLCSYARPPQWSCHANMPTHTCPVDASKVPMLHSLLGVVLSFTPPAFTHWLYHRAGCCKYVSVQVFVQVLTHRCMFPLSLQEILSRQDKNIESAPITLK